MKKTGEDLSCKINTDEILMHLVTISETVTEVNSKLCQAEQYVNFLKNIATKESRTLVNLRNTTKALLRNAMNVAQSALRYLESLPNDSTNNQMIDLYERLYSIMEKHSLPTESEVTDVSVPEECDINLSNLTEKIKYMESKQKSCENICWPIGHNVHKTYKADFDEKYPESCSRESLLDRENSTLPPVPEGAFTDFKRSPRSYSLLSIKTIKKMKRTLRQYNDESEDESLESEPVIPEMDHLNGIQIDGVSDISTPTNFTTLSEDSYTG